MVLNVFFFFIVIRFDDVGVKVIIRFVLGKNGEKGEEVIDERLKGIEFKMIELIMNEVIFKV